VESVDSVTELGVKNRAIAGGDTDADQLSHGFGHALSTPVFADLVGADGARPGWCPS
jgi:hypothetical protein